MVTIEQLYKALIAHGASAIQAAAITGNSVSEVGPSTPDLSPDSELNPEYNESGCIGLWCWEPVYFNPPRPTGDSVADMNNQVAYLKQDGGFEHADGADAESGGRNFALNYERCAECYSGGLQYVRRGEQAAAVAALAAKYGWDAAPAPAPKPAPKPEPTYHYDWFTKGAQRTAAMRYDANRKLAKPTAKQKAFLKTRQLQCKALAASVALYRKTHPKTKDQDHRGWREQQLLHRGKGELIKPES